MSYCLVTQPSIVLHYGLLGLFSGVLLHLCVLLVKAIYASEVRRSALKRWIVREAIVVVASATCLWILWDNMFVRFSCVKVGGIEITLTYFWPRPASVIEVDSIAQIEVKRDRRQRGELMIVTEKRAYRSVVCLKDLDLEKVRSAIKERQGVGLKK